MLPYRFINKCATNNLKVEFTNEMLSNRPKYTFNAYTYIYTRLRSLVKSRFFASLFIPIHEPSRADLTSSELVYFIEPLYATRADILREAPFKNLNFLVPSYLQGDGGGETESEEDDGELEKKLSKQRRKAIRAAHGGGRKNFSSSSTSRNVYKDKGGSRSSHNYKLHKSSSIW